MTETVYIVEANRYDETEVQGVYRDKESAESAVEQSPEMYSYTVREFDVLENPKAHEPNF